MASPNSVLSEHAFKRLQLGSDDEDDEEGAYGSDADEGLEGFQGDDEELAIARLGLPDELVATLEKRRRAKEAGPATRRPPGASQGQGRAGHGGGRRARRRRPRPAAGSGEGGGDRGGGGQWRAGKVAGGRWPLWRQTEEKIRMRWIGG